MAQPSILIRTLARPVLRLLNGLLGRYRQAVSRSIPRVELGAEHLRHTVVVPDRAALLERLPKGGVVAEIGVDHGDFSERILAINRPAELHLIDMWATKRYHQGLRLHVEQRFSREIAAGVVRIHRGRSIDRLAGFTDATFDWVYIDTDHSYTTTAAELELARIKVKPGGIIAGHDFVTGNWDGGVRYGVVEAVHEFCVRHRWEVILLTHETDRHLSFAIQAIT